MAMMGESAGSIEEFKYPSSGTAPSCRWEQVVSTGSMPHGDDGRDSLAQESADEASLQRLAKAFEDGRREGIEEGRRIERLEQSSRIRQLESDRIKETAGLAERLAHEHERLFQTIEPEVVKLALAIAKRILRHEAEVDPLMLTGAVRAALGQLADKTAVSLRVPAADAELWTETLEHLPNMRVKPAVIGDERLRQGECEVESDCGFADLSIEAEVREIAGSFQIGNTEPPEGAGELDSHGEKGL